MSASTDEMPWRESDHLKYTLGILKRRIGITDEIATGLTFDIREAAKAGVRWEQLQDEARMAVHYISYRKQIEQLAQTATSPCKCPINKCISRIVELADQDGIGWPVFRVSVPAPDMTNGDIQLDIDEAIFFAVSPAEFWAWKADISMDLYLYYLFNKPTRPRCRFESIVGTRCENTVYVKGIPEFKNVLDWAKSESNHPSNIHYCAEHRIEDEKQ